MSFVRNLQPCSLRQIAILSQACALVALSGIGCFPVGLDPPRPLDQHITLRYTPDRSTPALEKPRPLTIFQFADRRESSEGGGDPYWIGSSMRRDKVIADTPFQWTVARALAGGFRARGVDATAVEDRESLGGAPLRTPLALRGDIQAFSYERGWSARVEISMVLRLYDSRGTLLLEKPVAIRRGAEMDLQTAFSANQVPYLEKVFNEALEEFVRKVVTDPELGALLTRRE